MRSLLQEAQSSKLTHPVPPSSKGHILHASANNTFLHILKVTGWVSETKEEENEQCHKFKPDLVAAHLPESHRVNPSAPLSQRLACIQLCLAIKKRSEVK